METSKYILAMILKCKDPFDVRKLDTIVFDPDYFEDLEVYTMDSIGKAVYQKALEYLSEMYKFAKSAYRQHKAEYDASSLGWEDSLVYEAFDFLNPEKDLHWGYVSDAYYLEIDYWDLYASVIDTINDDYDSGNSFRYLSDSYTTQFYGGEKVPEKFDSLLL